MELARKYLIPGFVASSPRLFVSAASVLSFDVLLLILLAFVLILVAFVLIWVALLLILPVLVFTCVLNVVRSPVVASPVVDMVIVLVAGSLVTVIWVLPFNVSPSLTVAASLPTNRQSPASPLKPQPAQIYMLYSPYFAAADGNFWNYHITVLHFAPNDFVNFVHITLPLYIPKNIMLYQNLFI